ncbi:MAG: hypothetical protein SNH55_06735 [Rikenellaceae bacterium]
MIKRFLAISAALTIAAVVYAEGESVTTNQVGNQPPTMSARFVPDSVGIGDHTTLTIEVDQDMMQIVAFPDFDFGEDEVMEFVSEPTLDTISKDGRRVKLRREYVLRSFEAGRYNLGRASILYADKNVTDTLYTADSLRLTVGTFLIDSTSHAIYDIKPVRDLPFKFKEISGYATWGIIGLILLVLIVIAVLKVMAHYGRSVFGLFKPAPPIPPHVAAIKALDTLRKQHLWQNGEYKGYYSQLTDILRTYISGRYGVAAMEMTTAEIIVASKELELPKRCEMELQELLRDADLVKFAKAEIEASKNEGYFESVRLFVNLTKIEEEEQTDAEQSVEEVQQAEEPAEAVVESKTQEKVEDENPYAPKSQPIKNRR